MTRRLNDHIRLLESFAADVSHEFRNPLASIRTAAEMMSQADSAADRERFFGLMLRDVDRLERLVSGVRELARIDGQLEHEPIETLDLTALLAKCRRRTAADHAGGEKDRAAGRRAAVRARIRGTAEVKILRL